MTTLYQKIANGRYREVSASIVCEMASKYVFETASKSRQSIASPQAAKEYVRFMAGLDHEQFGMVMLDNRHRVLKVKTLFVGTIDGASVFPREVVKECITEGAAAVILFHNYPSGVADPSNADEAITRRLKEALALIDIRVLDHLIVAGNQVTSFAERGLL